MGFLFQIECGVHHPVKASRVPNEQASGWDVGANKAIKLKCQWCGQSSIVEHSQSQMYVLYCTVRSTYSTGSDWVVLTPGPAPSKTFGPFRRIIP